MENKVSTELYLRTFNLKKTMKVSNFLRLQSLSAGHLLMNSCAFAKEVTFQK